MQHQVLDHGVPDHGRKAKAPGAAGTEPGCTGTAELECEAIGF